VGKVVKYVNVSLKDLQTIFEDDREFIADSKLHGKPVKALGIWSRDHWELITVQFEDGQIIKYPFTF
jgi:hypothetical protein